MIFSILQSIVTFLVLVVPVLIAVAYFTLLERKFLSAIQRRSGPNVVGVYGLLTPLADGFKLLLKETVIPSNANKFLFVLAPVLTFSLALLSQVVIPVAPHAVISDLSLGVLYILVVSSLGVYGIIIAGQASNSKYAFLGALRSAAQMISYEVSIGFVLVGILLCAGSLNLTEIVLAQEECQYAISLFPLFLIFLVSILAETNRHPFDLPEAEAELVSGYNVEYSALTFALFFLGEYSNMIVMSSLTTIFFLGGQSAPLFLFELPYFQFSVKTILFVFFFIQCRAVYPRYRYDQLMDIGQKVFLPFSIAAVLFISGTLVTFNQLP